jgi:carbonic anhydrase
MSHDRIFRFHLTAFLALFLSTLGAGQAGQFPERLVPDTLSSSLFGWPICRATRPELHRHGHSMDMNVASGVTDKCGPAYTYDDGPRGPSHWEGVCATGHMQTPIDVEKPTKVSLELLPQLQFNYQPAELDMVNDCNNYQLKLRFPPNHWLTVARKPYRLSEIRFREPGETAVDGRRPPMALELVHLSPETNFLIVEVPVVVGKENPTIKTLWDLIPPPGQETKIADIKINVTDLTPADHGFYRFPGSLTVPICNEPVQWYLMKKPIEMSEAQIDRYRKYYRNTARPLQPLNNRPLVESQ